MKKIVKSNGLVEEFNYKKLQKSLLDTFRIVDAPEGQSKELTRKVLLNFAEWLKDKPEVTSSDIRRKTSEILKSIHPEASYIYKNFKNII